MFKSFLYHNAFGLSTTTTLHHSPFQFSLKFLTTSPSHSHPFAVSYLIDKFGFSPEFASKASKLVHFKTSKNPESVLNFFTTHGFTDSDIHNIIKREPWLLSCDTQKRLLPKFQFLLSKGASNSDIVRMVVGNPRFMKSSLNNRVIPLYKLVYRFLKSDQKAIAKIISIPSLISNDYVIPNINLMVDKGVCDSSIYRILRVKPYIVFCKPRVLEEMVEELKNMGLDLSKTYFGDALIAKRGLSKSKWDEKIDTYKKWGWSWETILEAIRTQPKCMLVSIDKINKVMRFWVYDLGWDSSYLAKGPGMFSYSLEKRIIPRAMVVFCLQTKGLRSDSTNLLSPFFVSEKLFLERFVFCFKEEEIAHLLKLYGTMMKIGDKKVSSIGE
ncbi:transcription termination factor MTERF15, mitochondrial [Trifolium repens]|jgi:mTERF domain-containing protein|nr:transcription termination factor MTERF15, mitochondrial [Trifolium repens]